MSNESPPIPNDKSRMLKNLTVITIVASAIGFIWFGFISYISIELYQIHNSSCGWSLFTGNGEGSLMCNLQKKYGIDQVNHDFLIFYFILAFTNILDIVSAIGMRKSNKNGLYLYIFSSLVILGTLVLFMGKYLLPLQIIGAGVGTLCMVLLYFSCFNKPKKAE